MQDDFDDDLTVAFRPAPSSSEVDPPTPEPVVDNFDDDVTVAAWFRDKTIQADPAAPPLTDQRLSDPAPSSVPDPEPVDRPVGNPMIHPTNSGHSGPPAFPTATRRSLQVAPRVDNASIPTEATPEESVTTGNLRSAPATSSTIWTPPTKQVPGPDGPVKANRKISMPLIVGVFVAIIAVAVVLYLLLSAGSEAALPIAALIIK